MSLVGQLFLLIAFVASGYAAFIHLAPQQILSPTFRRSGGLAAWIAVAAVTVVITLLAWALLVKDFRFAYVAEYSSQQLPWHYSLSALWVGQAGSLLVWAWCFGVLALVYGYSRGSRSSPLRQPAVGILMTSLFFLVAVMVFAADPVEASVGEFGRVERGMSPLLEHPAMLIHPPIIFLGYAAWGIPFALATAALVVGRMDADWIRQARPWSLFAWSTLGAGILLGGLWAYEELGWGGYWSWDPVENGSLIPWLTGTALIHAMMAWQHRGVWKKTALLLAVATFGLCNFATFLTRSGIFSSLHAFSQSPIGWMFLALMLLLSAGGVVLIAWRRRLLRSGRPVESIWSREAMVLMAGTGLVLLAAVACVGTLSLPLSSYLLGRKIMVGPAFYNNALIPIGLLLLATTAAAPLLRWGKPPTRGQQKALAVSAGVGIAAAATVLALGVRNPVGLAVAGLAAAALTALAGAIAMDYRLPGSRRRTYAGYLIHMGFVSLAVGVAGSSLGTQRHELVMAEGETAQWCGYSIRLARLIERELRNRIVAEAELEVSSSRRGETFTLFPAQHLHRPHNEWTTEVAIHSTWAGDFYTIARLGEGPSRAALTFVSNPLMRWIWLGGSIFAVGTLIGLWPVKPAGSGATRAPTGDHRQMVGRGRDGTGLRVEG